MGAALDRRVYLRGPLLHVDPLLLAYCDESEAVCTRADPLPRPPLVSGAHVRLAQLCGDGWGSPVVAAATGVPLGSQVVDMNGLVILNATGRCLWESLAEERSVEDLAAIVAEQFEVDGERARAEVQAFLDEIARLGLLEA